MHSREIFGVSTPTIIHCTVLPKFYLKKGLPIKMFDLKFFQQGAIVKLLQITNNPCKKLVRIKSTCPDLAL